MIGALPIEAASADREIFRGPKRGRPRDACKHAAMMVAARAQFVRHGVRLATMEAVARQAGVSRVTVYDRFGDKERLFRAVVRRELTVLFDRCTLRISTGEEFREQVFEAGLATARVMLDPDFLLFDRLMALEAGHFPDCARAFFRAGIGRLRAQLAALLIEGNRTRLISVSDPDLAADDLILLCQGLLPQALRLGICGAPGEADLARSVRRGVEIVLSRSSVQG